MDHNGLGDSHIQTHTQNEQPYLQNGVVELQRQQVTSKQIGKLQRSTQESTVEKPLKKKEHHENGSAPHSASCYTIMKHIMDEAKTFEDLDAA